MSLTRFGCLERRPATEGLELRCKAGQLLLQLCVFTGFLLGIGAGKEGSLGLTVRRLRCFLLHFPLCGQGLLCCLLLHCLPLLLLDCLLLLCGPLLLDCLLLRCDCLLLCLLLLGNLPLLAHCRLRCLHLHAKTYVLCWLGAELFRHEVQLLHGAEERRPRATPSRRTARPNALLAHGPCGGHCFSC